MHLEAFYHGQRNNWSYAYDKRTIHLRFRTKRNDVEHVYVAAGDKYDWGRTYREKEMLKTASDALFDYWEVAFRPKYKRLTYGFKITAGNETEWMTENGITSYQPQPPGGYFEFPYIHAIDVFTPPEWAKNAVFYQIFPERFCNGDPSNDPENVEPWGSAPTYTNYMGGDLKGVQDHLDYLQDLGVNAIYFTPLFESPAYHKYDTLDYKKIDPAFGTNEQLKELVDECHRRGIRVVLDAVFNHSSENFFAFKDVREKGEQSKYADWYHIHEFPVQVKDGIPTYDTFGFFGAMPKLNTANPEVKKYLLDVARYWIGDIKLDGWRLDVANEIDHHFWRDFRSVVKEANPDAYIIGEVWNDSIAWLLGDQFDSVMNYPFSSKVLEFFANGNLDGFSFANSMGYLLMRYPQQANEVVFNLLCSHDTDRALTRCGEDKRKLKLAVVFLMTYMGTPCIYYGDEIGLKGGNDPECRRCMEWDPKKQDHELYDFYKLMINLRKNNQVLRSGQFHFLKADLGDKRIIYERIDDSMHFMIWMNNHSEPTTLTHPFETDDWIDALSGEAVHIRDGKMSISLDPFGFRIISRKLAPQEWE
ncbi:alpha-glycosidase [Gorillibacterium massiliense]|uniref:alpha-glycosidase n=1 Tax=Gorillibacterium massiliense TaxID=1280390 RepID=UPI0004AF05A7|nr:alpha-glycosidase [Gorillibacterium massiliense]